VGVVILVALLH